VCSPLGRSDHPSVRLVSLTLFHSSVECALNVLGIRGSMHEKVPGFAEARDKFHRAREAGNIRVCRTRRGM
jgi:hypothetical protein